MIRTYPIYHINVGFVRDDVETPKDNEPLWLQEDNIKARKDLPKGRIRDNISYTSVMFQFSPNLLILRDQYQQTALDGITIKLERKNWPDVHPSDFEVFIEFKYYEEWCLRWFNHYTFDYGQSDAEVLESFRQYVSRTKKKNQKKGYKVYDSDGRNIIELHIEDGFWHESNCLMGAEDNWRWSGDNKNGERTKPPCRCAGCKKNGIIMINH